MVDIEDDDNELEILEKHMPLDERMNEKFLRNMPLEERLFQQANQPIERNLEDYSSEQTSSNPSVKRSDMFKQRNGKNNVNQFSKISESY